MPPKEKMTKEEIVQGALELMRQTGYEGLNARALANVLGCSTMPLFRHFDSMEEIRAAAVNAAQERYNEYIRKGLEEPIPFKGVGRAYIRFAKEEPQLFKLFFMTAANQAPEVPTQDPNYAIVAQAAASAANTSAEGGERIYRDMWIFVHGIASLIVTGKMTFEDEEIGKMLSDVFAGLCHRIDESNPSKTEETKGNTYE